MTDLKNEIKFLAEQVSDMINNDAFPSTIRPIELRDAVRAYPSCGGKRLRPIMLLWTCGMFDGDIPRAIPAAAAVEVFHNWTLVHDDIIDDDTVRRGKPTSHVALANYAENILTENEDIAEKFGRDLAILAGDIQQAWSMDLILRLTDSGYEPELVIALAKRMVQTLNRDLISGEAIDVELPLHKLETIQKSDILRMISGKTSALLKYAMQCGAALALNDADFNSPVQITISDFIEKLGLAYQLQDDLLGIYGDAEQFGKPLCSDMREGKPTLLLYEAKKRLIGDSSKYLDKLLRQPFYSLEMVKVIRKLFTDCGAEQSVREQMTAETNSALQLLETLPQNRYNSLLHSLTKQLLQRNI